MLMTRHIEVVTGTYVPFGWLSICLVSILIPELQKWLTHSRHSINHYLINYQFEP